MPPSLYWTYIVNLGLNVTWLILWDREEMPAGLAVIFSLSVVLIICQVISYRALNKYEATMRKENLTADVRTQYIISSQSKNIDI